MRSVAARLDSLDPDDRALLHDAAILGDAFHPRRSPPCRRRPPTQSSRASGVSSDASYWLVSAMIGCPAPAGCSSSSGSSARLPTARSPCATAGPVISLRRATTSRSAIRRPARRSRHLPGGVPVRPARDGRSRARPARGLCPPDGRRAGVRPARPEAALALLVEALAVAPSRPSSPRSASMRRPPHRRWLGSRRRRRTPGPPWTEYRHVGDRSASARTAARLGSIQVARYDAAAIDTMRATVDELRGEHPGRRPKPVDDPAIVGQLLAALARACVVNGAHGRGDRVGRPGARGRRPPAPRPVDMADALAAKRGRPCSRARDGRGRRPPARGADRGRGTGARGIGPQGPERSRRRAAG